ncbi:hypothetical protein [Sulfurimonas sp.]|jgi:hypothetical protein|uniref:hypothetical protein n=1 Tax=Sulfurimonas sp. TaxID=2022749 RepID=UPI002A3653A3|nr:hypothetical protein [Sulfurimonas sp.]MDY0122841.1 hypothetical protein [Sulfurimonas sp.]
MNIEEFKKKNKPKRASSLKEFEGEILELKNDNYSLKSIVQFLKKNGVITTFQNVSKFLKSATKDTKNTPISKPAISEKAKSDNFQNFKLERKGKDLEIKAAPEWATE